MNGEALILIALIVGIGGPLLFLAGENKGQSEGYERGYDVGSGRIRYDSNPTEESSQKNEPRRFTEEEMQLLGVEEVYDKDGNLQYVLKEDLEEPDDPRDYPFPKL